MGTFIYILCIILGVVIVGICGVLLLVWKLVGVEADEQQDDWEH